MEKLIWIITILAIGALLPFQAGLNTKLGKVSGSPIVASLFSFVVGTILLLAYVLISRQSINWNELKETPVYVWLGGVIGAFYIAFTILAFPKLGPGLMFGLIVAGQMTASVWLEHKNILVASESPFSIYKAAGVILIIIGVILIRKF